MRKGNVRRTAPDWSKLLVDAVNTPGILSSAYSRFWEYSVGNQLLALFECLGRRIEPGPIHSFRGWLELGRHVRKGEKAITLCMPVTVKAKRKAESSEQPEVAADAEEKADDEERRTIFVYKPRWFVLNQTEGDPYTPTNVPDWSEPRALDTLTIERVAFTHLDGNCQGFARQRQVAVSPVAALPHKTLFHELGHVLLGHTAENALDDHDRTSVSLREVEAECVALICCESLGLPGVPECRGYIKHWLQQGQKPGEAIPSQSTKRIFRSADMILKAGRPPMRVAPPATSEPACSALS